MPVRDAARGLKLPEPFTASGVEAAWQAALSVWGGDVNLSAPAGYVKPPKGMLDGDDPLAYINLETRQVVVNYENLVLMECAGSLTAVLAHELGHHIRFPHTLRLAADLRLMEQKLLPFLGSSLLNLFFDLQVNEFVGRTHAGDLAAVYRAFRDDTKGEGSPLFNFYLACYEELWNLPPNDLLTAGAPAAMDKGYPGWRAEARQFVQTFYDLPDDFLQFAYFCGRFARYVPPGQKLPAIPFGSDVAQPGEGDLAEAVWGNPAADAAMDEAVKRGWVEGAQPDVMGANRPLGNLSRVLSGLPGTAQGPFREAVASRVYRRLVDQHLIEYPRLDNPEAPDAFLHTTTQDWMIGDDPRGIDWNATVLARGPLAGAMPLRRELEPDAPPDPTREAPWLEVYLDTSGSMPSPFMAVNTMTLAAQVLSAAAIRAGSRVRGVVYSAGPFMVTPWLLDEETARRKLLHYVGGGTDFPFAAFVKHAKEKPQAIRVIISDSDFLSNVQAHGAMHQLVEGAESSRLCVALLAIDPARGQQRLAPALAVKSFRLVVVDDYNKFAPLAAKLARALFGKD